MATATWIPPDIASICLEQYAPLTQCSQTGFMFLALLTQLFGSSSDDKASYPRSNPYSGHTSSDFSSTFDRIGPFSSSPPESTILGQKIQTALGPTAVTPHLSFTAPDLRPILDKATDHKTITHSFGPKGSRGYSETSFHLDPDLKLGFGNDYRSPFSNFGSYHQSQPIFDYNFINRKSYFDTDAEGSEKVSVKEDKKKEGKRRKKRASVQEYDFIIVGAGSAGCVLANRLSEIKKWKILLLEAGPEEPDVTSVPSFAPTLGRSNIDWMYRTQPEKLTCRAQRGQTCAWLRGRTMGGSSAINYMVYIRGNRRDFDGWSEMGNHGWSFQEVLPYFKKSENNQDIESHDSVYHSVGGPLNVERFSYVDVNTMMLVQAFKEKGLPITDLNGENQLGTDINQSTAKNGRRLSVNAAYIRPIRHKRSNLNIITEAFVTKIIIDPITKDTLGVEYSKNGEDYIAYAKKEVVVSGGTLNSPKLLMLSGIGPKYHLDNLQIPVIADLKVGYNLQDHVTTDALILGLSNKTSTAVNSQQLVNEIHNYYGQHSKKIGPLATTSTLNSIAFIKTEFAYEEVPDIQFHFDGRSVRDFYSDPTTYLAANIFPLSFYDGLSARPLLLAPKSRGYVLLNNTDPIFGQPLIYPGFFTVKDDVDVLLAGMRYAVSLEETEAFRQSGASFVKTPVPGCESYLWGSYDYFTCLLIKYTSTIFHPVGTCKMGPEWDKDAVVDPRLRVYGIKRLRVIDASIMPTITRGNTNAPTIMIAEKGSDLIKEEWLQ